MAEEETMSEQTTAKGSASNGLLACPFCGGQAQQAWEPVGYQYPHSRCIYYSQCRRCDAQGPTADGSREARKLWNQRAG